ncbi:MAG: hypothetical protein PWQ55_502 [Chloroflexota bacterium]|nr:hypothetical protein [Chloroflexota bacterium]
MKKTHRSLRWISGLILTTLLLSACDTAAGAPESAAGAAAVEADFFSTLDAFQARYNFSVINMADLGGYASFQAKEDGFLLQGAADEPTWLPDIVLQPGDGLAVAFSFSDAGSQWAFVLEPAAADSTLLRIAPEGLSAQLGDQAQLMDEYSAAPDWQAEKRYVAFLHLNNMGGLDLSVWPDGDLQQITTASLVQVSATTYTLGMQAAAGQDLTVYAIRKLSAGTQKVEQAVVEGASKGDSDNGILPAEIVAALGDVPIVDMEAIQELQCNGQPFGTQGVFNWGSGSNMNCDLNLQMGQALAFDFQLAQSPQQWENNAYLMLNANMVDSDMPVKKLGVLLGDGNIEIKQDDETFDGVPYENAFSMQAGVNYSALVVMNDQAEFEIRIWPAGQPDQAMTALLGEANVPSTWRPVENENWAMGMWLAANQQVSVSHLYRITLGESQPAADAQAPAQPAEQEPLDEESWMATGEIPNLREFFIPELTAYDGLTCDEMQFTSNSMDLPGQDDPVVSECQIDLPNEGQGWITEFTFQGGTVSEDGPHLLDFAFINRDGDRQRLLRYTPHSNAVSIKVDDEYLDDLPFDGELEWVAGKRYTFVYISLYDKYFYVWPADDPADKITLFVPGDLLRESFGDMQPNALWQLRVWQGAGVDLKLENMYHFSAQ